MPKYVTTDQDGRPTAYYDTAVHTVEQIPPGAEPITDEQYSLLRAEKTRLFVEGEVIDGPIQPPSVWDVAAERERRLALGFDFDFGDERGVHTLATTPADMKGWDEVTKWSNAAIALGNGSSTLDILTETGPCQVTALEWQSVLLAATAHRQPLWAASFILQAQDPIPSDYTDDAYWTAE